MEKINFNNAESNLTFIATKLRYIVGEKSNALCNWRLNNHTFNFDIDWNQVNKEKKQYIPK